MSWALAPARGRSALVVVLAALALAACADDNRTCFVDGDGDGVGDGAGIATDGECERGQVALAGDCDDRDPRVRPGAMLHADCDGDGVFAPEAAEVCGLVVVCRDGNLPDGGFVEALGAGEAADCDDDDDEATHTADWYPDCDGDGFWGFASERSCGNPGGVCAAGRHPVGGFTTIQVSELIDCDDEDGGKHAWATWSADCDGDSFYAPYEEVACGAPDSFCEGGVQPVGGFGKDLASGTLRDCNDRDAERFPGQRWFPDCDRDGVFPSAAIVSCELPLSPCADGLYPDGGYGHQPAIAVDCDDEVDEHFGGQIWYVDCDGDNAYDGEGVISCAPPEVCGGADPIGGWTHAPPALVDCDDSTADLLRPQAWYPDCDADGAIAPKPVLSCGPPEASPCLDGLAPDGDWTSLIAGGFDCADELAAYAEKQDWFPDCDGDGAFATTGGYGCEPPGGVCADGQAPDGGWAAVAPAESMADCADEAPEWFPGQLWYADCDADDAFGASPTITCAPPVDFCADGLPPDGGFAHQLTTVDCDDEDPTRVPEDDWYADCDGDGYYRAATVRSCGEPGTICVDFAPPDGGWTRIPPVSVDCHDEDDQAWPGQVWLPDCDGDGAHQITEVDACMPPADWTCADGAAPLGEWVPAQASDEDCDDTDPDVHPAQAWYRDCDGDGAFAALPLRVCGQPSALCENGAPPLGGWRSVPPLPGLDDCDDAAASRSPTHEELCFDGIHADGADDDCDGVPDDGCPLVHSVDVTTDETWVAGDHVVTSSIAVRGATLSVAAGARVTFFTGASLTVGPSGSAAAVLTMVGDRDGDGPVVLTRDTTWADTSASQPGDWGGVLLGPEADGSSLSSVDVEFAVAAVACDRANDVTLTDLGVRFSQTSGVVASWCAGLELDGVRSSFNEASGVELGVGARVVVRRSELRNNGAHGLSCQGACMARGSDGAVLPGTFADNVITGNVGHGIAGMPFLDWPALAPSSSYLGNGVDAIVPPAGAWESGPFDLHWRKLDVPYRLDYFVRFGAAATTTLTIDGGTVIEFGATNELGIGTDALDRRAILRIDHSEHVEPVVLRPAPGGAAGVIHLLLGPGLDFEESSIDGLTLQAGYIEIDTAPATVARLDEVTVRDASGAGILVTSGSAALSAVDVSGCLSGVGFSCGAGCSLDIDASSFSDNTRYGVECADSCAAHAPQWSDNSFVDNGMGPTN